MLDRLGLIAQLKSHYEEQLAIAARAHVDARDLAQTLATESEKKEDGRAALEFSSLATGQGARAIAAREAITQLELFERRPLPRFRADSPIALGAVVDLESANDDGREERTFILLPVGAGTELVGPDGDGFLSVITPSSPVGRAVLGKKAGESVDVRIGNDWHEWRILGVG